VEVARLVSPRTAIRPSYTSAAIRAAPSPCRPFSLLLSPRSRTFPSPGPRGPACIRPRGARRRARDAVSTMRRDAELSRDANLVPGRRVDVRASLVRARRRARGGDVPISRDHGERRRGHRFFQPVKCNPRTCALMPTAWHRRSFSRYSSGMSQAIRIHPPADFRRRHPRPAISSCRTKSARVSPLSRHPRATIISREVFSDS